MTGCGDAGVEIRSPPPDAGAEQQSHVQAGQLAPAGQAGHAQAQPPPPVPPSTGWLIRTQVPEGQGVVKQAIASCTQAHESALSPAHDVASVWAAQGSGGAVQSHGAHAVPAGQAGQLHVTGADVDPELVVALPAALVAAPVVALAAALVALAAALVAAPVVALPGAVVGLPVAVPIVGTVIVVVDPDPQLQLQGGQSAPAGQAEQAHVHVPRPTLPVPQLPPPPPPAPPPPPVPPAPQSHAQCGQASPGAQAGQAQLQTPLPPPAPPVPAGGGGQSHATGGQAPSFGQASGWTQPQPPRPTGSSQQ